jgi:hypothetical protein
VRWQSVRFHTPACAASAEEAFENRHGHVFPSCSMFCARVHLLLGRGGGPPHRRSKGAPTHALVARFAGVSSDNRIVNM